MKASYACHSPEHAVSRRQFVLGSALGATGLFGFFHVDTRYPTNEERKEVAAFLRGKTGANRTKALQNLAWALLASSEFRFNH